MAIPDHIPETPKQPTEEARRERARALKKVRQETYLATERLYVFLQETPDEDVIQRIHAANTKIINQDGSIELVRYYSLWTNDDTRLTASGKLLRSDYYSDKYSDMQNKGADTSYEISAEDLASYDTNQLISLTNQLEKFLKPREN